MVALPTQPAVGDQATASWADAIAGQGVIADSGVITASPTALNTVKVTAVVFSKTFPSIPKIFVTISSSAPQAWAVGATGATTVGCNINTTQTAGTLGSLPVQWFAVVTQ